MHLWRDSTKRQYWSYVQIWLHFCVEKHVNPMSPSVSVVLDYLASLFHAGIGYSGHNTARSALSSFVAIKGHCQIGKHNFVNRFMRGIFYLKLSLPRYNFTWNVSDLLKYLAKLDNHSLSLKQITLKCVSLLVAARTWRLYLWLIIVTTMGGHVVSEEFKNVSFEHNFLQLFFFFSIVLKFLCKSTIHLCVLFVLKCT